MTGSAKGLLRRVGQGEVTARTIPSKKARANAQRGNLLVVTFVEDDLHAFTVRLCKVVRTVALG